MPSGVQEVAGFGEWWQQGTGTSGSEGGPLLQARLGASVTSTADNRGPVPLRYCLCETWGLSGWGSEDSPPVPA